MTKLATLQAEFLAALRSDSSATTKFSTEIMDTTPQLCHERLQIYQEGYWWRLHCALIENLPLLSTSMDEAQLSKLTTAYIDNYPSTSYSIQTYGQHLPNFIAAQPWLNNYPYLAEIAALDLALLQASRARAQQPLTLEELQQVAPENWHYLQLELADNVRLLEFKFNIPQLWQHNKITASRIQKLTTPQAILIWRQQLTNRYRSVTPTEAQALTWLGQKITFGELCTNIASSATDQSNNIAQLLQQWLSDEILVFTQTDAYNYSARS